MAVSETTNQAEPTVVTTPAGSVTLLDLPSLKSRVAGIEGLATQKQDEADSLGALRDDRLADIGALLLDRVESWTASDAVAPMLQNALALRSHVQSDETELESIRSAEHHGLGGLVERVGDWNAGRKLASDRVAAASQLRLALIQLGAATPEVDIPDLHPIRDQAQAAEAQARQLHSDAEGLRSAGAILQDELERRQQAEAEMGFDSLYQTAYLQTYGPGLVDAPLNLKRGEQAIMAVPARLARNRTRTQFVGGSQGFSFPIGHTGIRYRVGSYHGQPVQQQVLSTIDTGTLVVTDQRIAFVGQTKSTSTALSKLVHVQCYSDALAVFQEGRENADYFFVEQPKYVLFMLNWALGKTTS